MYLRLVDVGHAFAGRSPLFEGISAAFGAGDVVALTGPSGSGKSTLLSIIAGWLRPTHGRVDLPRSVVTAWVFQNPHGVARRTALDHGALPVVARGATRAEADAEAMELLESFHLRDVASRRFGELSGGEAQRLMLARAAARVSGTASASAGLMLVDEPTAQLDRANATAVVDALESLARLGAVVVIAPHDVRVRQRCTRVLDLGVEAASERTDAAT